jgi:hypothetical protein
VILGVLGRHLCVAQDGGPSQAFREMKTVDRQVGVEARHGGIRLDIGRSRVERVDDARLLALQDLVEPDVLHRRERPTILDGGRRRLGRQRTDQVHGPFHHQ